MQFFNIIKKATKPATDIEYKALPRPCYKKKASKFTNKLKLMIRNINFLLVIFYI